MNPRGRPGSGVLSGSPVLIGAVTVVVALVAVFLSYNANEGLPFVPTYDLTAEVPNSAGLVRGNEVRIGGSRVGVVSKIDAESEDDGAVTAKLTLKLDSRVKPLPVDSQLLIRPRSALGLKYVEITKGTSNRGFPEKATIPLAASAVRPVEIDDFFNTFDDATRMGMRANSETFGAAFAERGESINRAFAGIDALVRELGPAMTNLSAPETGFDRLFPALEQAAAEAAPVAGVQASLWVALDTTFEAWAGVSDDVQDSISEGPPALDTAIRELPLQRPFLAETEELFRRFRPAFAALSDASPGLAKAFQAGTPALLRTPALNRRLTRTIEIFDEFAEDERVPHGLKRLTAGVANLRPLISFIKPAQATCNYLTLLFRNAASAATDGDSIGSVLRVSPLSLPTLAGSEAGPTATPSNGPATAAAPGTTEYSLVGDSFLHSNPLPNTAAPEQIRECEAGNEGYDRNRLINRQMIGNVPGDQGTSHEFTKRVQP